MGTVVIIGGGSAGAPAARSLSKKLGRKHRLILVEKEETLVNPAVFPLFAVGKKERGHLSRKRSLLKRSGAELIAGEVLRIDPAARTIYTAAAEIGYDLLLIAAGAGFDRTRPPGMAEAGIDLQTLAGAERIRALLPRFQGAEIAVVVASTDIKCPCSPYEYALLLEDWFRRRERSRDISITIYTPERAPLCLYGQRISEAAAELLLKRNIGLHPGAHVRRVDPDQRVLFLEDSSFPFDLLLYCAETAPPPFIRESPLGETPGWVKVDPRTMAVQEEDSIFAVGDVTEVRTPSGASLPKMGAVAHLQSFVAAANMAALMKGEKAESAYRGIAGGFIETGRGAFPFAGGFYRETIDFLPFPTSRLWSPLKTIFSERWWLRDHS